MTVDDEGWADFMFGDHKLRELVVDLCIKGLIPADDFRVNGIVLAVRMKHFGTITTKVEEVWRQGHRRPTILY